MNKSELKNNFYKRFGEGKGRTKKAAEQQAAYKTILMLRERNIK